MTKDDHDTIHVRVAVYWGLACVSKVEYPFDDGERVREENFGKSSHA
jgi:hypothetical protein